MSRIGNRIIDIPPGVKITPGEANVEVKGPSGTLNSSLFEGITVNQEGTQLTVKRANDSKSLRAKHGLVRALIQNNIIGVTDGFSKTLILQGVGYRAQVKGKNLVMNLGYSHDVVFEQPSDIKIEVPEPTKVKISGINKQRVGQIAAQIRSFRKPEPYKGKGVRYENERIRRKAGKTGKK